MSYVRLMRKMVTSWFWLVDASSTCPWGRIVIARVELVVDAALPPLGPVALFETVEDAIAETDREVVGHLQAGPCVAQDELAYRIAAA